MSYIDIIYPKKSASIIYNLGFPWWKMISKKYKEVSIGARFRNKMHYRGDNIFIFRRITMIMSLFPETTINAASGKEAWHRTTWISIPGRPEVNQIIDYDSAIMG